MTLPWDVVDHVAVLIASVAAVIALGFAWQTVRESRKAGRDLGALHDQGHELVTLTNQSAASLLESGRHLSAAAATLTDVLHESRALVTLTTESSRTLSEALQEARHLVEVTRAGLVQARLERELDGLVVVAQRIEELRAASVSYPVSARVESLRASLALIKASLAAVAAAELPVTRALAGTQLRRALDSGVECVEAGMEVASAISRVREALAFLDEPAGEAGEQ